MNERINYLEAGQADRLARYTGMSPEQIQYLIRCHVEYATPKCIPLNATQLKDLRQKHESWLQELPHK